MIPNTESITSLKISLVCLLAFLGVCLGFWMRGVDAALSYGVAYLSFLGVFFSLYLSMKKRLADAGTLEISENEDHEEQEVKIPLSHKVALGFGISLAFFRIFAYILLIIALIFLLEFQLFDVYAYMIGVFSSVCGVLIFLLL
ncbi:hypothetical protein [Helicobacter pametensis]|nr:hypothetical protein [Helicobacter pametensis]